MRDRGDADRNAARGGRARGRAGHLGAGHDAPCRRRRSAVHPVFDAYDAWHCGDVAATPPAYRVAFDAADRGLVTGTGNLLLGMSGHVNRDLPFALAEIGIVKPDGTSRKPDHDKVNEFLNRVMEGLLTEAAARFDPTVDDGQLPFTTLDDTALLQLLVSWREGAWRNAERLVTRRRQRPGRPSPRTSRTVPS